LPPKSPIGSPGVLTHSKDYTTVLLSCRYVDCLYKMVKNH